MPDQKPASAMSKPALTPEAEAARRLRQEKEAAALRANLLRRKAQSRARAASAAPEEKKDPSCR
ncbi:MAG: hypothetical protein LKH33_04025 [Acetobacter sp.]|nr:hypothetical protein [Acetobacter sp.]MCH4060881.1 hypothetical protein [Acetobacter sp.]MCH4087821.1 hypothetical protein [Acetobacter sp.]MCI1293563.1 hypothetical protein [Acetobacter sp.]MCI1319847.1 hypothetical protein [Acetobacter sp.]